MDAKQWVISQRLKAKQRRQRIEASIYLLERQAEAEAEIFGQPQPATLKKIQHRKLKLTQI